MEELENFKDKQNGEDLAKGHERTQSQQIPLELKENNDDDIRANQTFQITLQNGSEGVMVEENTDNKASVSKKK